jgi:tetratricopeptide (TPR) repeat protein
MILYALVEGHEPAFSGGVLKGRPVTEELIGTRYADGRRPEFTIANEPQIRFISKLWATNPCERLTFSEICQAFEQDVFLFGKKPKQGLTDYIEWLGPQLLADSGDAVTPLQREMANSNGKITTDLIPEILRAAQGGDPEAQRLKAMLYLSGSVVEPSLLQAVQSAVASGDPNLAALATPGRYLSCWDKGQVLEGAGKIAEAALEYKRAAEHGCVEALWRWGSLLIHNDSGLHYKEGITLLKTAANRGVSEAAYELAELYKDGAFISEDEDRAVEYYQWAFHLQHPDAAIALSMFYLERFDFELAYEWARKARDKHPEAKCIIQRISDLGQAP